MIRSIGLAVVLFALWLLLSGQFEPLLIGLGLGSCVLVVYITHRMNVIDHEGFPIHLGFTAPTYWLWLGWEIVKANMDVVRIILTPSLPISPTMFRVKASQKSELGHVVYANSITLTPGTVTVDIIDDEFEVHALTSGAADELQGGLMDRMASRMESNVENGAPEAKT